MKDRPILFSAPMVRAILEGRKTQTRRVVKPQPYSETAHPKCAAIVRHLQDVFWAVNWRTPRDVHGKRHYIDRDGNSPYKCPYGQPGDSLWVRETWAAHLRWNGVKPSDIDGDRADFRWYRADGDDIARERPGRWRPSIHMPRWASRLNLLVTDVRVERVQDISPGDAAAEGIAMRDEMRTDEDWGANMVPDFASLWDSINAKRGYSWEKNPWVWAVTFEVANG